MTGWPLIANDRLRDTVARQIDGGRLPHAVLIEGCDGSGKTTLVHFLARAAVCTAQEKPCDACRNCHLAAVGTHPDISFITPQDGKKTVTVAQIRALRNAAYVKPHQAACRVFIIRPAESMNESAQNALLKVLEEPPAGVLFFLLARSRTDLLPTVLSRCAIFSLHCPTVGEAAAWLCEHGTPAEKADSAAKSAQGCIGAALRLLDTKSPTPLWQTAQKILDAVQNGALYEQLQIFAPFEKDRVAAENLIEILKSETVRRIRELRSRPLRARPLESFYIRLHEAQDLLVTNINLPLLFCTLASETEQQRNRI